MWLRILILASAIGVGIAIWGSGVWQNIEPEVAGETLRGLGAWGPVLFVILFAFANGLGSPGIFFMLPAIAVWPVPLAFVLIWTGAFGAGCVGFVFARTLGRDWVATHLPENLRGIDARIAGKGIQTVVLVRITVFLLSASHWALGLSAIRTRDFLIGSAIGFIIPVALWTVLGGDVWNAIKEGRPSGFLTIAFLFALAYFGPRWLSRSQEQGES